MSTGLFARLKWPGLVVLVTGCYGLLPLLGSKEIYLRGDSAAQFAPTWWHFGEQLRDSGWPVVLDPSSFAGGNYSAEALFGIWNPINALIWLFVHACPDLLVAVTVVKVAVLVALALGTYLVCREYDAEPWAAAAIATALPFSGFTLWWDAGSWPAGLIAFAYAPWVWLAFRRTLQGRLNPLVAFAVGALAVTQGNPYGTLAVVIIGAALIIEGLVERNRAGAVRLLLTGGCVAALLPLVYLPLVRVSEFTARSSGPLFGNNGKLRPELGDLLGMSSPTFVPGIISITGPNQVPVTYFCWFILPLLPWLRYGVLRHRARALTGLGLIGLGYLLLTLGPSNLWLFRWPLRLIEYFFLALGVALAVVLSKGLRSDHWRARAAGSGAIVAALGFQAWAQHPTWLASTAAGVLLLAALVAAVLVVHRRGVGPVAVAAVLIAGTGLVLTTQALVFEENEGARVYRIPTDVDALQEHYADLDGRVLQFADLRPVQRSGTEAELRAAWDDFLPGSMYHVAGVDAVNNYTGMGFQPFENRLCLHYEGFSRPCGYANVWKPVARGGPPLVDLLKIDTIVAQGEQTVGVTPLPGWDYAETGERTVLVRTEPLPWPESRLSRASDGVEVGEAVSVGHGERVEVDASKESKLTFAMIPWPGYSATVDGKEVDVDHNKAGLMVVTLPKGTSGTLEIAYDRPGKAVGNLGLAAGLLGALVLGAVDFAARRRRRTT
ncbi:hypothetical protein ACFQ0K_03190 [Nocardioides caeni]|uniref:hypothetical protein n=1 Tax=Nocardioides caeni TaxID=574700 RepID=UPI0031E7F92E